MRARRGRAIVLAWSTTFVALVAAACGSSAVEDDPSGNSGDATPSLDAARNETASPADGTIDATGVPNGPTERADAADEPDADAGAALDSDGPAQDGSSADTDGSVLDGSSVADVNYKLPSYCLNTECYPDLAA